MDTKAFSFNSQAKYRTGGHFKEKTALSLAYQEIMVDDKGSQFKVMFPDVLADYQNPPLPGDVAMANKAWQIWQNTPFSWWQCQLNFTLWCASAGCGVSFQDHLQAEKYNSVLKDLRKQTRWVCLFHCKDRDSFEDCLRENDVIPSREQRALVQQQLAKTKHAKLLLKTDLRIKLPSGRAARSWVALTSVIRAFRANLSALACMRSAISMSPMSSGSSSSTLQVEKTAEAPSTSNLSLASLRISIHWSAGSLTEGGTWSSRSVNGRCGRSGRGRRLSSSSGMGWSKMNLARTPRVSLRLARP